MTLIKCTIEDNFTPCKHVDDQGYCTRRLIELKNEPPSFERFWRPACLSFEEVPLCSTES